MRKHTKLLVFILVITALVGSMVLTACTNDAYPTGITLNDSTFSAVAYGGEIDLSGKKVIVSYSDDTTTESDLTASMLSGFSNTTVGQQTVTVTLTVGEQTLTTTFTVNVLPAEITGISVTTLPKTSYFAGETFDPTGMVVTVSFEDGSTTIAGNFTVDKTDALTVEDTFVTVTFGNFNTTVDITVTAVAVESIEISTKPTKVNYYVGETFAPTGMVVTAIYNNGDREIVTDYTVDKTDALTVDDTKVTVKYGEFSATVDITVVVANVTAIEVNGGAFANVKQGEEIDLTGRTVKLSFEDGSTKSIDLTADMLSNFDKNTVGPQTVKVSYTLGGVTVETTFEVTVVRYAIGIEVNSQPTNLTYYANQTFDATGLTLNLVYSNNTRDLVERGFVVDTTTKLTTDDTFVTVTYDGFETRVEITVNADGVASIEINGNKDLGDVYFKSFSDDYDLQGMQITVNYLSGIEPDVVDVTLDMCSDITEAGQQVVTVTYEGKTDTFAITVIENTIVEFEIVDQPKANYFVGDVFDPTGMTYQITYLNGDIEVVTEVELTLAVTDGGNVSLADPLELGEYTLTVKFNDTLSDTVAISVVADEILEIVVTTEPRTNYYQGEEFDPTGMVITANYMSGKTEDVTAEVQYDNPGKLERNVPIEFRYMDYSATIYLTVAIDRESEAVFDVLAQNDTRALNLKIAEDDTKLYEFNSLRGEIERNKYFISDVTDLTNKLAGVSALSLSKEHFVNYTITNEGAVRTLTANLAATAPFIPSGAITPKLVVVVDLDSSKLISYAITYNLDANGLLDVEITIADEEISTVTVKQNPTKVDYFAGDTFNAEGLVLEVTLANTTTFDVDWGFTVNNTVLNVGDTVTVTYNGIDVTIDAITITALEVILIEISDNHKVNYYEGDTFDTTTAITAIYNNGERKTVTDYTVDKTGALTVNDTLVSVSYGGVTFGVMITVISLEVVRIAVTNQPAKVNYFAGDTFDPRGMVVRAEYNSGKTEDVTIEEIDTIGFTFTPDRALVVGDAFITVSYGNGTTDVAIEVIAVEVVRIEIGGDYKNEYFAGDTFDATGMVVTATFNNGSVRPLEVTEYSVSPEALIVGQSEVAVTTTNGVTANAAITVTAETEPLPDTEIVE